MTKNGGPFVHELTKASKDVLDKRIKKALQESGLDKKKEDLEEQIKTIESQLRDENLDEQTRKILKTQLDEIKEELIVSLREEFYLRRKALREHGLPLYVEFIRKMMLKPHADADAVGGCFPGTAIFVDKRGRERNISSMHVGDEVQVITNKGIMPEPVITFIHHQPEVMQEFLKITTMTNNILKITEDHLMFVEKMGQAAAIPARDVKVGDTVYVRGKHSVEKDAVQSISTVYEKGVYAPVTLSGTILVNNVHTSCYFDVLSHEWSHRAMGVARAVHYVSPWMLQWISGVGQKDGFPGWCRLAHKMLTLLD